MVTVIGGRVGLDYSVSLNCPTVTGATLINQTVAAIVYDGLEAGSVVGATIRPAPGGVAVLVTSTSSKWGEMSIIDSSIEVAHANASGAAVVTGRSLYLRNVFIKGYGAASSSAPPTGVYKLDPNVWSRVDELAVGRPIPHPPKGCAEMTMSVFVDGAKQPTPLLARVTPAISPPATLASQHSWDEPTFPTMDMPAGAVANVRAFGAVGDGLHDDTAAIQKALDVPGAVVLLPKGFYRISRTLTLAPGGATALLGVARTFSVLMAASDGLVKDAAGSPDGAAPILRVTEPSARIVISMFTIVTWEHLSNTWALDWQNHNPLSVYRQGYFYRITECLYNFNPNGTVVNAVPSRTPTMPCRPLAVLVRLPWAFFGPGFLPHIPCLRFEGAGGQHLWWLLLLCGRIAFCSSFSMVFFLSSIAEGPTHLSLALCCAGELLFALPSAWCAVCLSCVAQAHPLNVISGSISAYNFENEDFLYEAPKYRHMLVQNNRPTDRVTFYQAGQSQTINMLLFTPSSLPSSSTHMERHGKEGMQGINAPSSCAWRRTSARS